MVLLITPPYHCGVVESAGTWLNLGFVYIAESIRKAGHDVEIYDAMSYFHSYDEIVKKIETSKNVNVVATTAITATINDCIKTCKISKKINSSIVTIIGGVHPTFCWEEILNNHHSYVDYIIIGEGELTIVELLDYLFSNRTNKLSGSGLQKEKIKGIAFYNNGQPQRTPPREYITHLDTIKGAWDLVDWSIYTYRPKPNSVLAIVNSSRGCTQKCSFCSQQLFWNQQWRAKSPEFFISELQILNYKYGVNSAMISDETPTHDRIRWESILDILIERNIGIDLFMETRVKDIIRDRDILWKYKKAGISHIYVGVESTNQDTLDAFNKDISIQESMLAIELINNEDIISETSFVLGMPNETEESIKKTLELAIYYNPDMAFFLAITPWPYSDIYDILKPHIITLDYSKYNLIEPVVKPVNMTVKQLKDALNKSTMLFYKNKFVHSKMTPFKKDYMLAVMKLLMEHSYLASQMKEVYSNIVMD